MTTIPTHCIRGAAKQALVDILAPSADSTNAVSTYDVCYGEPRSRPRDCIIVGDADGTYVDPYMMAGRKRRKDDFTVTVWCMAATPGRAAAKEADDAALALFAVLEDALADDSTLDIAGVSSVQLDAVRGPYNDPTNEGYVAAIRADVAFVAQMQ